MINCYPNDLEAKITNGQAYTNVEEPYFIKSCEGDQSQNLMVIDTKTPYASDKFDEFKVASWVTKDSIVYKKNNYETRTYSFAQIKDFNWYLFRL